MACGFNSGTMQQEM
jgi:hypothetical protein